MTEDLGQQLLALRRHAQETRAKLVREGSLFDGYAPAMEQVHVANAERLQGIIDRVGWPGTTLVGREGAEAAWLVAQHAISRPAFQRRCLELIHTAVKEGEAPPEHEAYLTDRIRFNERQPQVFGTICDWDENGELTPWKIEEPESVDARRAAAGLPPLAEAMRRLRAQARTEGNSPPVDFLRRQRQVRDWARKVGWL